MPADIFSLLAESSTDYHVDENEASPTGGQDDEDATVPRANTSGLDGLGTTTLTMK